MTKAYARSAVPAPPSVGGLGSAGLPAVGPVDSRPAAPWSSTSGPRRRGAWPGRRGADSRRWHPHCRRSARLAGPPRHPWRPGRPTDPCAPSGLPVVSDLLEAVLEAVEGGTPNALALSVLAKVRCAFYSERC